MIHSKHIQWHELNITKEQRSEHYQQKPCIIWLTGLSGSGKSTIANVLEQKLFENGNKTYVLDGDNIRHGLNKDLGFDEHSRVENIRRIGEVAKLFVESGHIIISAFISPFIADRHIARSLVVYGEFIEVFVDAPLEVCEARDPKGLYKKVRQGAIKNFTGIDSPYEQPITPELHVKSDQMTVDEACSFILNYLVHNGYIQDKNLSSATLITLPQQDAHNAMSKTKNTEIKVNSKKYTLAEVDLNRYILKHYPEWKCERI